jgi:hypothetical protein
VTALRLARAIAAAGLAIVLVHQPLLWLLHRVSLAPWPAFDLSPRPPLGVPALVTAVFWGALWGPVIDWLGQGHQVRRHARAAVGAAVLTTLVGAVLTANGLALPVPPEDAASALAASLAINGGWGAATSMLCTPISARQPDRIT